MAVEDESFCLSAWPSIMDGLILDERTIKIIHSPDNKEPDRRSSLDPAPRLPPIIMPTEVLTPTHHTLQARNGRSYLLPPHLPAQPTHDE